MADSLLERYISEWRARLHAAQHESTAAHVSASDEFRGEQEAFAKASEKWIRIFRRGYAAQENDLAVWSYLLRKCL